MMIRLVYSSSANSGLTRDGLVQLLIKAREYNARQNITGLLLYKNGEFLQVLEGDEAAVRHLYHNKIARDTRHTSSLVLFEEPIEARLFSRWSMGFRSMNDKAIQSLQGFDQVIDHGAFSHYRRDPSGCLTLFSMFVEQTVEAPLTLEYFP